MRFFFIALLFVFSGVNLFAQKSGVIYGKVIDERTQEPLPGTVVRIEELNTAILTDKNGDYEIKDVPIGTYRLKASFIGYRESIKSSIVVATGAGTQVNFQLEEALLEQRAIVITSNSFEKKSGEITSVSSLSMEEIRRTAGGAGDVIRMVQSLPGVALSDETRNDLIVRGGSNVENATYIDDIEVQNPNHYGTVGSGGGAIGLLNVYMLDEAKFYTGGFSARYGDKLSSVLTIKLRTGNTKKFEGKLGLDSGGGYFTMEGPFSKKVKTDSLGVQKERSSYLMAFRKSYLELIKKQVGLTAAPNYWDYQVKANFHLSSKHSLSLIHIIGVDNLKFTEEDDNTANPQYNIDAIFKNTRFTTGATWKYIFPGKGFSTVSFSHSYFFSHGEVGRRDTNTYEQNSTENQLRFDTDVFIVLHKRSSFRFGINAVKDFMNYKFYLKGDTSDYGLISPGFNFVQPIEGEKLGAYLEMNYIFTNRLSLVLGIRADAFSLTKKFVAAPRTGVRYNLTDDISVSFSYGIFYQTPLYIWLASEPKNESLEYMRADHYVLSFEKIFKGDLKFSVEPYYKYYSYIPVQNGQEYANLLNYGGNNYDVPLVGKSQSTGLAYAFGIDFFVQKKLVKNTYGQFSYSLARSEIFGKDISGNQKIYPAKYDYRHSINISAGRIWSKHWESSIKWRFLTGRPFTPFDTTTGLKDISRYNSERYESYHRLDLRTDYRKSFNKWNLVVYAELQNAYNRKNIFDYLWIINDQGKGEAVRINSWSLIPIIGLSAEL